MNVSESALVYHRTGLCVLPAKASEKRPSIAAWKTYQQRRPTEQEVRAWFSNPHEALCIVTGAVSGNVELLDFDLAGELFEPWKQLVQAEAPGLYEKLVAERSPSGGRHITYRSHTSVPGNAKLAQRLIVTPDAQPVTISGKEFKPRKAGDHHEVILTLIETRGEGGLFLCAPSPGYAIELGGFENLPVLTDAERNVLIDSARALNERVPQPEPVRATGGDTGRPGDEFNRRGDVRARLQRHGWTLVKSGDNEYWRRPGKDRGWSATLKDGVFFVHSSNAAPFEPEKAYAPFSVYAMLEHSGDFSAAAAALRGEGYGADAPAADVNLTGIIAQVPVASRRNEEPPGPPDPGPLPEDMLRVPGFVSEVMDHCLDTAPYPNPVMAFCGALCLQAFLAGRKIKDTAGNRTNIYLLGLAHSATGKDWPRRVNMKIAHRVGVARAVAERFASGEGLQDALLADPCMLFQTDEIDGMFRVVNGAQDSRHEFIISQLLMMYSSAGTAMPVRRLAKSKHRETGGVIDQPCLVLFGTAIPNHYYDALSARMLSNGLFARMLVLESGPRSKGKDAVDTDPPARVLATAKWWAEYAPGEGNLCWSHPSPAVVEQTDDARACLAESREHAEAEYSAAEKLNDQLATSVWGRVDEQIRKLALIYAISADHLTPRIGRAAVQWARGLILHQTRRMLFMAKSFVAENPFDKDCLRFLRKLRESGGTLAHSDALKNAHMPKEMFTKLVETLVDRGEIEVVLEAAEKQGRPSRTYRLV